MMDKQLKNKAIDIKGKQYVQVSDRILFFNEHFENGCIQTELLSAPDAQAVVIQAKVIPDVSVPDRYFTDYAQEVRGEGFINKASAMENCSTSAVGRALGMMGIGVIDGVASVDEITKATNRPKKMQGAPKKSKPKFTDDVYQKRFDNKEVVSLERIKEKYSVSQEMEDTIIETIDLKKAGLV